MNIKKSKKADIVYGDKDILKDTDFETINVRQRISILVPQNILKDLKTEAANQSIGYQTLINQILRSYIQERPTLEDRVNRLEQLLKQA